MIIAESKTPVLMLSYDNCEICCCHLDGYKGNQENFCRRLELIDAFFDGGSQAARYRIWLNIDDSVLTEDLIEKVAESVLHINDKIVKIAFVGVGKYKNRLNRLLKRDSFDKPLAYFSDAENAKEWLV